MLVLEQHPPAEELEANARLLEQTDYPGRVIVMGLDQLGTEALQVYILTGRSDFSRDRVFEELPDGFKTKSPTKTQEEMDVTPNAALIYYKAIRNGIANDGDKWLHVVSNGAQTDSVFEGMIYEADLESAAKAAPTVDGIDLSKYEPDEPNNTPRITGAIDFYEEAATAFGLTIVRKDKHSGEPIYKTYGLPTIRHLAAGVGYVLQTYKGNGEPIPSFDQAPYAIELDRDVESTAQAIWAILNKGTRVALVAQAIDLQSGEVVDGYTIDIHS